MRIRDGITFDIDLKMKARKIHNLTELSLLSQVSMNVLEVIYHNYKLRTIPDKQLKKLCDFFECELEDLLTKRSRDQIRERREYLNRNAHLKGEGVVYFLLASGGVKDGLTKIGFSSNVLTRIKTLMSEHKCTFDLVHYLPTNDAPNLEKLIHIIYEDKRIRGEWFNLKDEDLNILRKEKDSLRQQ